MRRPTKQQAAAVALAAVAAVGVLALADAAGFGTHGVTTVSEQQAAQGAPIAAAGLLLTVAVWAPVWWLDRTLRGDRA